MGQLVEHARREYEVACAFSADKDNPAVDKALRMMADKVAHVAPTAAEANWKSAAAARLLHESVQCVVTLNQHPVAGGKVDPVVYEAGAAQAAEARAIAELDRKIFLTWLRSYIPAARPTPFSGRRRHMPMGHVAAGRRGGGQRRRVARAGAKAGDDPGGSDPPAHSRPRLLADVALLSGSWAV